MRRMGIAVIVTLGLTAPVWADETPPTATATTTTDQGGIRLGVRANGAKVIGDASDAFNFGFGFAVRGGWEIRMGDIGITPELMVSWDRWGASDAAKMALGLESAWSLGLLGGARLGYAMTSITPWIDTHFGLQHGSASVRGTSGSSDKFGLEVGAGLDYMVAQNFGLGVFFAFNMANTEPSSTQWLSFGVGGSFGL